jgi:thioredoxin-dependent peroxiredoxin
VLRAFALQYFAASVDTAAANAEFAASLHLDFPVLSDPSRDVARAYGVLSPSGFASRRTFYIGIDGRILAVDKNVTASSHGTDIVAKLNALGISRTQTSF